MILQRKLGVFYLFTQFLQLLHITVISTISDSCWQSATTEITHRLNGSLIHLPQHNKLLLAPLEQEFTYTIGQLFDNKIYIKILCQPSSVTTKPGFKETILVAWSFVLLCNSFVNNKLANLLWWYEAILSYDLFSQLMSSKSILPNNQCQTTEMFTNESKACG